MKKILYIDEPLDPPGGGQISLLTILKNIDRSKFQIKVFLKYNGIFKDILEKDNIECYVVDLKSLYFKIKKYNPDIVHINSACTKYTFFSAFFSKLLKKKVIWHNRVIESSPLKEKVISYFVDKIIVISDAVRKKFYSLDKKVVKLYNPIDINITVAKENLIKLKNTFGINRDAKIIGIFSRIEKWKGHSLILKAFSKIKIENVFLIICGVGSELENLKRLVVNLDIKDKVFFTGYVDNVYDYINICDIIVNPSVEPEPFGRVIIEAMSFGKPVIATNIGGPKEIIKNNEDGILVSPDENEIKNAIEKLLQDKDFYLKISQNAIKKSQEFNIKDYMKKLYNIYEELL